jgi:hypothetical protein
MGLRKVVAIHQPQYLPWPAYIDKADRADLLVLLDNVQFQRSGVQNRNAIKGPRGKLMLTVPVSAASDTPINRVRVAGTIWRSKHVATIRQCYARARHLALFEDGLRAIIEQPATLLCELNRAVTQWLFAQLGVKTECILASELGCSGKADDLLLALCRAVGATVYLSGQGARAYQDDAKFRAHGIAVEYQQYQPVPYRQQYGKAGFVPDLSALDLLLNEGPDAARILRAGRQAAA